jgi:hypothetical protein
MSFDHAFAISETLWVPPSLPASVSPLVSDFAIPSLWVPPPPLPSREVPTTLSLASIVLWFRLASLEDREALEAVVLSQYNPGLYRLSDTFEMFDHECGPAIPSPGDSPPAVASVLPTVLASSAPPVPSVVAPHLSVASFRPVSPMSLVTPGVPASASSVSASSRRRGLDLTRSSSPDSDAFPEF